MLMVDRMGSAPAHPPTPLSPVNPSTAGQRPPDPPPLQRPTNRSEAFDKQLLGVMKGQSEYVTTTEFIPDYRNILNIRRKKKRKISIQHLPTCVTLTGSAGLLLGLTALVFGLCVSLGQQRRNGLPQQLGLGLAGRKAPFLGFCQSFLLVQTGW